MSEFITRLKNAVSDRYAIEREVGTGGMATVFLARDLKHERQVALKVLKPELAAVLGERFPREIKIAAKFNHPHILSLYDSGEREGFLYYVMPFVEGESLRQRLDREGPLRVGEATRILVEVVDALAYAHAHGVVHRDIKPANIMLAGRHAVVTDFGVAKAVSSAGRETLTTVGIAVGTLLPTHGGEGRQLLGSGTEVRSWSSDGTRAAYGAGSPNADLYLITVQDSSIQRVTDTPATEGDAFFLAGDTSLVLHRSTVEQRIATADVTKLMAAGRSR